jgi:hypothetical protein
MSTRKRRNQTRIPQNIKKLLLILASRGLTGEVPEEIEAVAVLLDRLRRQYGDRQWSEQEVVSAMEQIVAESSLESAMQSIGL